MVISHDITARAAHASQPAQTAPRLDGSMSARLWHFRLMRASLRSRINPAAFAARPSPRTSPRPWAARAAGTLPAPLSSDARHEAAARSSA